MNVCACMGPMNGEPLCPCRMKDGSNRGREYSVQTLMEGLQKCEESLARTTASREARARKYGLEY